MRALMGVDLTVGPGVPPRSPRTPAREVHVGVPPPALAADALPSGGWGGALAVLLLALAFTPRADSASASLLGWNNLGMHCMDSDYEVFSILPPYNTIEAQLIVGGKLLKSGSGYTVTYEAVADPDGSINSTSIGKGNNFYTYTASLYGPLSPDEGLAGWGMPGPANTPQPMRFEALNQPVPGVFTPVNWFRAEGIPITPTDDAGNKNPYPLLRLVAKNALGQVIARSDVVAPVSDEMDCTACHGSAETFRQNILQLHDDTEFARDATTYGQALQAMGYQPEGLHATAAGGQPILCAKCHASEALGTKSFGSIPSLTAAMHSWHADVTDPVTSQPLGHVDNRSACYRCHPGSETRCLRGAMGSAVAPDGSMAMQCQSCHGGMAQVGSPDRVGWLMEPTCQSCHTGTATHNNGQIRYSTVFEPNGTERIAVDSRFATTPDTPAAGLSLYRFSTGHGGLQCSACHGSTHAEFPAAHRNDNLRNVQLQGHAGVTVECTACHTTMPTTISGGPHGMHPLGQDWVNDHHDAVSQVGLAACRACHGADDRGSVLSRVQASRTFRVGDAGDLSFYRGATMGCYTCHQGPSSSSMNRNEPPTIADVSAFTTAGVPVDLVLPIGNAGAVLRVISQPSNGSVGLIDGIATYFPYEGFTGTDTFTFAAYDGAKNSALATGTVTVGPGNGQAQAPTIDVNPASQTVVAGADATFTVAASGGALTYQWYRDGWAIPEATDATLVLASASAADAGTYVALVSNETGSTATAPATLSVTAGLVITTQPASQTVVAGATVTFTVVAAGTAPLTYQWSRNGVPISGATSASLGLWNVTLGSAGDYQVRVTNPVGSVLSAIARLTVQVAPQITLQPLPQTVFVGAVVTFSVEATGTPTPAVQWYKDLVVLPGATAATLVLPSASIADAGEYHAVATNPAGSAASTSATLVVLSPPPTLSGFSPGSGPVGTPVTISGSNLDGATAVSFHGTAATFTVVSSTEIATTVPNGASSGPVSVSTPGGTVTSAVAFTVTQAVPTIASFSPGSGGAGTAVTIDGANFAGAYEVLFNGVAASFTVTGPGTIIAGVPKRAPTGAITVTTPGGTVSTATDFTVSKKAASPSITSLQPGSGPVGTIVTLTGSNLGAAVAAKVGSVTAPFAVISATQVAVTIPAGAATARITVSTPGGNATSSVFVVTP